MKAAVDSNIILDILLDDPNYAEASMHLLEKHLLEGALIISPLVFTECAAALGNPARFETIAGEMGLRYEPLTPEACSLAAGFWRQYRSRKKTRQRILADFLIGAHAQILAEALLTRDRGFYRDYFKGLKVIAP